MGRFDPVFSDQQRAAIVRNQLERGESADATVEAAAAGRLALPPFEVSASTCRRFAQASRRNGRPDVRQDNGHEHTATVKAVAEATIRRVRELDAPTAKDLSAMQTAHRLIEEADRTAARHAPIRPASTANDEPSELLTRLLADRDNPRGPDPLDTRHQLGRRWVRAQVALEKPKGGEWGQRVPGRPHHFEEEWRRKLTDGDDLADLISRETAELEKLEARVLAADNGHTGHQPEAA